MMLRHPIASTFVALALGATAVGIGRPQAWSLAAFGQSGVEAVIDILNRELIAIMRRKAAENNRAFQTSTWTPRMIDKVLWVCGR